MKGCIFQALESLVLKHRNMAFWNALVYSFNASLSSGR